MLLRLLILCLLVNSVIPAIRAQQIDTSGVTIIHVTYPAVKTPVTVTAQVYHVFPARDYSKITDSLTLTKKECWIKCPVRVTQTGYLWIGDDKLTVFMIPGDTIHVSLSADATFSRKRNYTFDGITKRQQAYYLAKRDQFPLGVAQMGLNAGMRAPNLSVFRHQLDSLQQVEHSFWQQYQKTHALPEDFIAFESNAMQYIYADHCLHMVWYQIDYQKKTQPVPASYFDFLRKLPITNKEAQYQYEYLNFLSEYVYAEWRARKQKNKATQTLENDLLGEDLGGFFRLWDVSSGAKDNPEVARTKLQTQTFPGQYQYLVQYLISRSSRKQTVLASGDKAPDFYLTDKRDSLVSLSQFKGKVVFLCFWFVGCGACQKEFPLENKLVNQFKNKPVEVISICMATPAPKWKEAIRKIGLQTTNLHANPSWQKTLEQKYQISSYPHYVLIDANGKIAENFAPRPSNNAAAKISDLLNRTGN